MLENIQSELLNLYDQHPRNYKEIESLLNKEREILHYLHIKQLRDDLRRLH